MIQRFMLRKFYTFKFIRKLSNAKRSKISNETYVIKGPVQFKNFAFEINKTKDELEEVFNKLGVDKSSIVSLIHPNIAELILDHLKIPYKIMDNSKAHIEIRAPIVTIVGHVDHGKTTLLDRLRKSSIAINEVGGITQKISAFTVNVSKTQKICIVDTPGHSTFSNVRSRGVQVTDLVILVIAADSGVQEQTLECLELIKAADIPYIICITKIDKKESKIESVYNELLELNIPLIKFGGSVPSFEISSITGKGIKEFVEFIPKEAERLNLIDDRNANAVGNIIDLYISSTFGILATCILKQGTLKRRDYIECSTAFCRVKQLILEDGSFAESVRASQPFHLVGWLSSPSPGETFFKLEISKVKDIKKRSKKEGILITDKHFGVEKTSGNVVNINDFSYTEYNENYPLYINLIFKCENFGSAEAVINGIKDCSDSRICMNVFYCGIENLETHTVLALPKKNTLAYTLSSDLTPSLTKILSEKEIPVNSFSIIYRVFDHIKAYASQMLHQGSVLELVGRAKVLATFQLTGKLKKSVIGMIVTEGHFYNEKNIIVHIYRQNLLLHVDTIASIKRFKNDVKSVKIYEECGISVNKPFSALVGDIVKCYKVVNDRRYIDWHY